ncbi:MAG: LysM peptidoglycan-binding domain-containing protein, partial [Acidimicrobiales bacterium]
MAAVAGLATTYVILLVRAREVGAEREMALAFRPGSRDRVGVEPWLAPSSDAHPSPTAGLHLAAGTSSPGGGPAFLRPTHLLDRWAVTRFVWAGAAARLLQVVVALTERVLGDNTAAGASGRRLVWIERSVKVQRYLRRQSLRALTASAAATAGATALSSLASPASATGVANTAAVQVALTQPLTTGSYTVSKGDTLGTIAKRFGTTVAALASANHIGDPNLIYAGQVLALPGGKAAPTPAPAPAPAAVAAPSTAEVHAAPTPPPATPTGNQAGGDGPGGAGSSSGDGQSQGTPPAPAQAQPAPAPAPAQAQPAPAPAPAQA